MKLLIVESPTKTKTLRKFLGREYDLASTNGHIIDLPKSKLGVDIDNGFDPEYVIIRGKAALINELVKKSREASQVYLAPDPDREGEAIAYHVASKLSRMKGKIARVTFNEITKKAVLEGIANAHKIDTNRVNAQQARRILDRLVGYQVSPLLWKTVMSGLSAGRVQSVALRLICEREAAIEKFVQREYWTIDVDFADDKRRKIRARLIKLDGKKPEIENEASANEIKSEIGRQSYTVTDFRRGSLKRQPQAPFITSTLQQEAFTRLGFNNAKTMLVAQQLYEGIDIGKEGSVGLITYMRTDSFRVADEAKAEAHRYIVSRFGEEYLPGKERKFKARKSAQEAHEAIRPTSVYRDPESLKRYMSKDLFQLYQLIWARFVASQMADAVFKTTTLDIAGGRFEFRAAEQELVFDGFTRVYGNGAEDGKKKIPEFKVGTTVTPAEIFSEQHFTQPPPRFNAGSLVKELEDKGIGRPSTYAQIISTLTKRKYVIQEKRRFKPTDLGRTVNKILVENFTDIFDVRFTAKMEDSLDSIEEGKEDWVSVLRDFYASFSKDLARVSKDTAKIKQQTIEKTSEICDKCGSPMVIKHGRNGRFLACSSYPKCRNTKPLEAKEPAEKIEKKCPNCGAPMEIRTGRFGRFIACTRYPECKTTESLPTGVKCPEEGCTGELVEKRSRKGRRFYACSRYPECKFTVPSKPVAEPCPACGYSFMVERMTEQRKVLVCPRCKHTLEPELVEADK